MQSYSVVQNYSMFTIYMMEVLNLSNELHFSKIVVYLLHRRNVELATKLLLILLESDMKLSCFWKDLVRNVHWDGHFCLMVAFFGINVQIQTILLYIMYIYKLFKTQKGIFTIVQL